MLDQWPRSLANVKDLCEGNLDNQQYRLRYVKCCQDGFDFSEIPHEEIDVPSWINSSNTWEGFCTLLIKTAGLGLGNQSIPNHSVLESLPQPRVGLCQASTMLHVLQDYLYPGLCHFGGIDHWYPGLV